MDRFIWLAVALMAMTYSQLVIKWRSQVIAVDGPDTIRYLVGMFTDGWVISAFLATFCTGVAWFLVIQRTGLAFAYPFMALSFVLVPLGAVLFLNETFSWIQLVGITVIVTGVALTTIG